MKKNIVTGFLIFLLIAIVGVTGFFFIRVMSTPNEGESDIIEGDKMLPKEPHEPLIIDLTEEYKTEEIDTLLKELQQSYLVPFPINVGYFGLPGEVIPKSADIYIFQAEIIDVIMENRTLILQKEGDRLKINVGNQAEIGIMTLRGDQITTEEIQFEEIQVGKMVNVSADLNIEWPNDPEKSPYLEVNSVHVYGEGFHQTK